MTEKGYIVQKKPNSKEGIEAKCYLVNTYTAIIQEYFQLRLDNWMETVGKEVFGIKHVWLRFEFTKGRGQIHAHLLGITLDLHLLHKFYEMWEIKKDKKGATDLLSEYVRNRFDLSEELPSEATNTDKTPSVNPISLPYCQIIDDLKDKIDCVRQVHLHKCNNFCLRKKRKNK